MKTIKRLVVFSFSTTGPWIISFGTFGGLTNLVKLCGYSGLVDKYELQIFVLYLVLLYLAGIISLYQTFEKKGTKVPNKDSGVTVVASNPLTNNFFSGGFSILVDWILESQNIVLWDIFIRPSYWAEYPEDQKDYPIVRFSKKEKSMEIRFPKNKAGKVFVREANSSHEYDEFRVESLFKWWVLLFLTPLSFLKQIFS